MYSGRVYRSVLPSRTQHQAAKEQQSRAERIKQISRSKQSAASRTGSELVPFDGSECDQISPPLPPQQQRCLLQGFQQTSQLVHASRYIQVWANVERALCCQYATAVSPRCLPACILGNIWACSRNCMEYVRPMCRSPR